MTSPTEESVGHDNRPPRKDHRSVIQANKLRTELIVKAIQFGNTEPSIKPRSLKILFGSTALGAIGIVASMVISVVLQLIQSR
ncbi:MAG: hypothetical protein Q4D85_06440 [Corynebacterium sp.]|uniref:hypothetical protein n=1 Tax=Corynebacterium sp. TaxID=1720 RepID=UPI0026DB8974|nr:hypothetical protein [Corynebacterium sp.]MDO5098383.1 hypothetical protein [Corynebacterium sp.]